VGSAPAVVSAVKTAGHIRGLKRIQDNLAYECTCGACASLIEYAITQKEWKLGKKGLSAVPGVGTVATVGSKLRASYKKWGNDSLGKYRHTQAVALWHSAREGCQTAKAVVSELLGAGRATQALLADKGYEVVFKKLAST
jgi:hypothetical protein